MMKITKKQVLQALSTVIDPDLHKDIVTLGFIQGLAIARNQVSFTLELTTPACPMKEQLKEQCLRAVQAIDRGVDIRITMSAKVRQPTSSKNNQFLKGVKNIIAVASGKGGVGKSTTAVHLAKCWQESSAKVGILDADIYGPSLMQMLKISSPPTQRGQVIYPAVAEGIKIISMAMFQDRKKALILRGPMAANMIKKFLVQVDWGDLDYLLIDYPPGTGDIQLTISQSIHLTGAVIVTTPQEVALIDVRKSVDMFSTLHVPILGVVESMSYFICDQCEKKHRIFGQAGGVRLSQEFGLPLLHQIPLDGQISENSDQGTPMSAPDSVSEKAYYELSGKLAAEISTMHTTEEETLTEFHIDWKG